MNIVSDITYNNGNEKLDLYLPDSKQFPVLIYFHGGGLQFGDKTDDRVFIEYMVSKGFAVASANYRLYPNAKYPQFIEDAAEAVNWVYKNIGEYGVIEKFYIGGSSAGGYISMMLFFDKNYLGKYAIDADDIDGYILNSGQPTTHFNVLHERGCDKRRVIVDEAAPLYHITENREFAPFIIIVAENDMENRLEQNQLLYSTIKHFSGNMDKNDFVIVDKFKHCEYCNALDEYGENVFGKIVMNFVDNITP